MLNKSLEGAGEYGSLSCPGQTGATAKDAPASIKTRKANRLNFPILPAI
jgi:hypothetical protein